MQVYAQAILNRKIIEDLSDISIANPSTKIPYFMQLIYGNIIMEAIGKPQYKFHGIRILNDKDSYILYRINGERYSRGKKVKTNDLIEFFRRKKLEVSISVLDIDSE